MLAPVTLEPVAAVVVLPGLLFKTAVPVERPTLLPQRLAVVAVVAALVGRARPIPAPQVARAALLIGSAQVGLVEPQVSLVGLALPVQAVVAEGTATSRRALVALAVAEMNMQLSAPVAAAVVAVGPAAGQAVLATLVETMALVVVVAATVQLAL